MLTALKKYGMIVADNGSSWFVSGSTDSRWNDNDLNQLKGVPGSAFEAVQTRADPARPIRRPGAAAGGVLASHHASGLW